MTDATAEWKWDSYERTFATVTTRFQMEVYESAATYLYGNVCEFGSGAGKFTPYINGGAPYFVGVDASSAMHRAAKQIVKRLPPMGTLFEFVCERIENFQPNRLFDSGVSINSLYGWESPKESLSKIADCLKTGGVFVLASPNDRLPMEKLLQVSQRELIGHPHFGEFSRWNLSLAGNRSGHFYPLDELVDQTRASFKLKLAHQTFFLGGLSFLVLEKR